MAAIARLMRRDVTSNLDALVTVLDSREAWKFHPPFLPRKSFSPDFSVSIHFEISRQILHIRLARHLINQRVRCNSCSHYRSGGRYEEGTRRNGGPGFDCRRHLSVWK